MPSIAVQDLVKENPRLELRLLAGKQGLDHQLDTVDVNRPGLALAGFFNNFANNRLQVFGKGEHAYLEECNDEDQCRKLDAFFQYEIPIVIFTHNNIPSSLFLDRANKCGIPVLSTRLSTHKFIVYYTNILDEVVAPEENIHGELMDIYGVGIIISGPSGIGKSETALELIERGHQLVADDIVRIRCVAETRLIGRADQTLKHFMELRGLGIINVKELFGVGAIKASVSIDLSIVLSLWDDKQDYERFKPEGLRNLLGVEIPELHIPVRPGRNIPVLIEAAAMKSRSQSMGYDAASVFNNKLINIIKNKNLKKEK